MFSKPIAILVSVLLISTALCLPLAAAPVSTGYLELGDSRLFYESQGEGPALVLVHDGLVHSEIWDAVWQRLSQKAGPEGYRLVRYDRRGYGRSGTPTERYVPRQDLVRLLDHLQIPQATLVASSSGGDLAARFAIAYPSRVERLVLVGAVVSGLGFSEHFVERGQGPMSALQQGGTEAAVEAWRNDPYLMAPGNAAARQRFGELLLAHPQNLNQPPGLKLGRRAYGHLEEIMAPTLILVGESDHPDVHAHAGALQAAIPGSRRQILPGSGHLPYLEVPDAFVAAVETFLAKPTESASTFDLRVSPCLDFYYYVRTLAAQRGDEESSDELAPEIRRAVEAVRALQKDLGTSTLNWSPLDRKLEGCQEVSELAKRLGEFDGSIFLRGRPPVEVGERAAKIGESLAAAEEVYLRQIWPAHLEKIEAGKATLEATLMPQLGKALEYHLRSLGMRDPKARIPVHLVSRAPWPGAHTLSRGGEPGALCFVAVEDLEGGMLEEIVLHEASHALSILTEGQGQARGPGNVVEAVRLKVAELPLPFSDRRRRDISHNLLFIQSAETIRRILDPNHLHYGDVEGYYDRVPTARSTLSIWVDHLNGAISRRDAMEALVDLGRDPKEE